MKKKTQYALIGFTRWIGRQICKVKGHNYFHPGGLHESWCAYSCVRCGELDRPFESLPDMPKDEEYESPNHWLPERYIEQEFEQERRWVSWLPYPKWI